MTELTKARIWHIVASVIWFASWATCFFGLYKEYSYASQDIVPTSVWVLWGGGLACAMVTRWFLLPSTERALAQAKARSDLKGKL